MKQFLTFLLLLSIFLNGKTQNLCDGHETPLGGMPEELYRGRLKRDGALYGNPYTLMDRTQYPNANDGFIAIRSSIQDKKNTDLHGWYKTIYKEASRSLSDVLNEVDTKPYDSKNTHPSPLARWAKYNAFLFVIGLDTINFDKMAATDATRITFRNNAMDAFKNMNCRVYGKHLGLIGELFDVNNLLQGRCRELKMYCEAYDWLKASASDPELVAAGVEALKPFDEDRNGTGCMPRDNLRLFARNFYIAAEGIYGPIEHIAGWKRNHGIMAASAIGMAAIVLNDAGVETDWFNTWYSYSAFGFFIRLFVEPIPHPNYSPVKWDELGQKCWENLLVGYHIYPFDDVPQTSADGSSGYAEGPGYFNYAMAMMLPYIRTYNNWAGLDGEKKTILTNMLTWQERISRPGGEMPTYDDTGIGPGSLAGLFPEWSVGYIKPDFDLGNEPDYVAVMTTPTTPRVPDFGATVLLNSGNAILRATDGKGGKHYGHLLFESGFAVDVAANSFETPHEHEDYGTFLLSADDAWLAVDPPYLLYDWADKIDAFDFHNTVKAKSSSGATLTQFTGSIKEIRPNGFSLGINVVGFSPVFIAPDAIIRSLDVYNTNGTVYYFLNDKLNYDGGGALSGLQININGNGSNQHGESSFIHTDAPTNTSTVSNGRFYKWSHPCQHSNVWGLLAHTASIIQPSNDLVLSTYNSDDNCIHGSGDGVITNTIGTFEKDGSHSLNYGIHSRMVVEQTAQATRFQTLLLPYRCGDPQFPSISRIETPDYVATTLRFYAPFDTVVTIPGRAKRAPVYVMDSTSDFHLSRMDTGTSTVTNPFNIYGDSSILEAQAEHIFMSRSSITMIRPGACEKSIIPFKQAQIRNGKYLKYDDTLYISSADKATISYSYEDKFKYSGSVSAGTTISFYMPDMQFGYLMVGKMNDEEVPTNHSAFNIDSFMYISVTFPQSGDFTLELKDPCAADCYFPLTTTTIDTLFSFNIGQKKPLNHDLDIVQGMGELRITNMSRMNICPDNVLVNKDSITMYMECAPERRWIIHEDGTKEELQPDTLKYICDRKLLLADRAVNKYRNTIIVNERAGLVLDSGSVTHIGNNSTILIRSGGTLLIKKGATVIIGDSDCVNNRGELLADNGSYVCVEEGAHLLFYNDIDSFNFFRMDTADRHMVYIAMPDSNGSGGANLGVNHSGGRGKFDPTIDAGIWAHSTCVPFCDWKLRNPPYGVDNRSFGWCNISEPRAYYKSLDTLCVNYPFSIDARKSLNETGYSIGVCKFDTSTQTCTSVKVTIVESGDYCLGVRYLFTPTETGYYQVRLIVRNDCNQTDTFTKIVYVPNLPLASFTAPDSICPGTSTLHANGSMSRSNVIKCKHRWTVEPIKGDSMSLEVFSSLPGNMDWLIDSATVVDSNFNFPGYEFAGGVRYLVSLKIWGWCSDSTVWDTVSVPLRVKINMEAAPRIYSNPVGPSAVMLKGSVLNATSWNWNPTTYLSEPDSLNTVAIPTDSIIYILTGNLNGCSVSDSVFIRHNTRAYAGDDRSVCFNQETVLGTDYNVAAFFGLMYTKLGSEFWDRYSNNCRQDHSIQKYYDQYLIETGVHNSYMDLVKQLWFDHPEIRDSIMADPSFANYIDLFMTSVNEDALKYFRDELVANNSGISDAIDGLPNLSSILSEINDEFNHYSDWYDYNESNSTFVDIIWEKKIDTAWFELTDWRGYYNPVVDTNATTTYRMTLIDNANSLVEYDEVIVTIDTVLVPSFGIAYQMDSTVYINNTSVIRSTSIYDWNFGDGSSHSFLFHPSHIFPAFDSSYRVCLTVTNMCGSYQFCDTIRVDSFGLTQHGFGKRGIESNEPAVDTSSLISNKQVVSNQKGTELVKNEVALENIPNPFTEYTTISYAIGNPFSKAELRVTDVLGRLIKVYPITTAKGKLDFDGSSQTRGMYYSTLVIDGVIVKSKTMLIER